MARPSKKNQVRTSLGKRDPAILPPPWQKQERHGFQHDSMAGALQSGGFAFSQERSFHEALLSLRGTKSVWFVANCETKRFKTDHVKLTFILTLDQRRLPFSLAQLEQVGRAGFAQPEAKS